MEVHFPNMVFATRDTLKEIDHPRDIEEHHDLRYLETKKDIVENIAHSNDNLDELNDSTEYKRIRLPTKNKLTDECAKVFDKRREHDSNKLGSYNKESPRGRVTNVYGTGRKTADCNCKNKWVVKEWAEATRRTIRTRLHVLAAVGLCLSMLATCAAAPAPLRSKRSTVITNKSVRNYLETFGYLDKGRPEVENLVSGNVEQEKEDDFRIAIKTLQEFGGIPVTGEIDEATQELLGKKRCGRPDRETFAGGARKKRFAVHGDKWQHTNLTWSLSSYRRPSTLDIGGTRRELAKALDVWQQASRLTFTEVNSEDSDILVSFAKRYHDDAYPFDGRGTILAHAFFPGSGRGGDAHFDDEELWLLHPNNDDEDGTSLFAVAAHEFGHSLGLSHSTVKGALMYPWYQGIQPNFVLPEDDRNGIQQMYGPKERKSWAQIPYYRPVETPPPTTTTTTTTTTTKRPYHHHNHHNHYPDRHPNHRTTTNPRPPIKHPVYNYPEREPSQPERPSYYPNYPRRHHNTSEDYPRRPSHNYPRPTPETTTQTPRPRYPNPRPPYPQYPRPNYPTEPRKDYPKKDYPRPKPHYPTRPTSDKPDTCDTTYDAVSLIRGELFIFKDRYHWRIGARGHFEGYPIEITRMWSMLPKDLSHVDAVYERPDKKIAFFIGRELYLFDSQTLVRGYPKRLVDLGLPASLDKIDAAMTWGHNGKTYFYSGSMYWKFDEDEGRVELDYPRDMSMWKGVGYNIDSVFQWKDGKTYFFKGKGFWKFNDLKMRVEHEKQHSSAQFWMNCPGERAGRRAPFRALPAPGSTLRSPSTANNTQAQFIIVILLSILQLRRYFSLQS